MIVNERRKELLAKERGKREVH
jgi:hypothetical protein